MKRYWTGILILITIIGLGGCGVNSVSTQEEMKPLAQDTKMTPPTFMVQPSKTVTATITTKPLLTQSTKAAVEQTATPATTSSPSVTRTSIPGIHQQCIQVSNELPKSATGLSGKLVLVDQNYKSQGSYLLDLANGERTKLPDQEKPYIFDAAVSPNGEWLGYVVSSDPYKDDILLVVTPDGKIEEQYQIASGTATWTVTGHDGFDQWLDDHRLVIGYGDQPGEDAISLVLDAFTGEWQTLPSNYPDLFTINQTDPFWGNFIVTRAIYHPSLELVLYPSYEGIVLWDRQAKNTITTLKDNMFLTSNPPVWSPDGESFMIDLYSSGSDPENFSDRNIYRGFKNGDIEKLTTISDKYPTDFMNFSWSPDGNSIAFWISVSDPAQFISSYELAVLDLSTRLVKAYCIPVFPGIYRYPQTMPIWSPDSHYIAFTSISDKSNDQSQAVLVDLVTGRAYHVADGVVVAGWMKAP